jgi:L-arabinose isomerase
MSDADDVKETLRRETQRTAQEVGEKTKAESERLMDEAQRKAQEVVVARKQAAAEFIHDMSEAVSTTTDVLDRQGHHGTASLLKSAAGELDRLSTSMSNREIDSLLHDFRDMAHRKPTLFFGGALLVGFGAARFLSASASHSRQEPGRTTSPGGPDR